MAWVCIWARGVPVELWRLLLPAEAGASSPHALRFGGPALTVELLGKLDLNGTVPSVPS